MIRTAMLCDQCDAVFVTEERQPHRELTRQAHEAGWTSISRNGEWTNTCPDHTTN